MEDRFLVQKQLVVVPFGKRFHALDTVSNEPLFVHRFYKGDWDDEDGWHDAFEEWVDRLSKIDSPAVPRVISKGEDEDGIYVILSRLDGIGLADLVDSRRFGVYAVREFFAGVLEAGRAAAEVGIIHGAFDPRRITVGVGADGKQSYLVEDFGLPFIHQKIQKATLFLGLPPFTSVGQSRGENQDERGELFSIGQMMLYCLAAGHPFSNESLVDIGGAYDTGNVPRLADFCDGLPADLLAWHETLSGVNGVSGFESFGAALEAMPLVLEEEVLNVDMIAAELTAAHDLTATDAVGVVGQTKLITGSVAVKPAEELMAEAGVSLPQQKTSRVESAKKNKFAVLVTGIVAGVLVIGGIVGFLVSHDDSDETEADSIDQELAEAKLKKLKEKELKEKKEKSVPMDGLIFAWDFDGSLSGAKGDTSWKAMNRERYDEDEHRKGVILGVNAYYQTSLRKELFIGEASEVTINFWFKAPLMWDGFSSILSTKKWAWASRNTVGWIFATEGATSTAGLFRWNVSDGESLKYSNAIDVVPNTWTMVTLVKSGASGWSLYQDGVVVSTYAWSDLNAVRMGREVFLGCDSDGEYRFSQDVVVDNMLIWERPLSASEVSRIHDEELEYYPVLDQ